MNKTELTSAVAEKVGLSLKDARATVDAIFSTGKRGIIASELAAGRKVQVTGFGSFETRKRKARQGRNPQTGEPLLIAASRYPAFHPGRALKERVRTKLKK
jgi:DNA-binding protein HU-beta